MSSELKFDEDEELSVKVEVGVGAGIKCPVCNKLFYPAPNHIYKNRYNKKVCSYSCARKSGWKG